MSEDPLRLNCPKCGEHMKYVQTTDSGVHIYTCRIHGNVGVWPNGRVQVFAESPKAKPN
jgi:hypothetical protein